MRRTIRDDYAAGMSFTARYIDPPPTRPGGEDALKCPSRTGERLHHRDGRITDINGNPLKKGEKK